MLIVLAQKYISNRIYLFVTEIIKETATIAMQMPIIMFVVSGSPNINVPTRIAVMGSKTPKTDAFVAPILRVAIASVAVETMVGNIAKPIKFSHATLPSKPAVMAMSENVIFTRNTNDPTIRA